MKVQINYGSKTLSKDILIAESLIDRLIGLMFREKLVGAEGLLIDPCRSIHTCFMRYSLDIVFLSSENKIIKIIRGIRPWRITWIYFRANKTLELPAGKLPSDLKEGDILEVKNV
ncbi:MAG: DUF192 domain-containing protein [Bdellovibrionales bacterium]|nr:DUF192 domain-containing protein [Bdellovibrionales bacterium]